MQVFSELFVTCVFIMLFFAEYLKPIDQSYSWKTKWFKWKLEETYVLI